MSEVTFDPDGFIWGRGLGTISAECRTCGDHYYDLASTVGVIKDAAAHKCKTMNGRYECEPCSASYVWKFDPKLTTDDDLANIETRDFIAAHTH